MKLVLVSLCALLLVDPAFGDVRVTGTGKVNYVPDIVHIRVGVATDAKTAAEAWEGNRAVVVKLFEVMKKHGIAEKDRQTTGLQISPRYVTNPKDQESRLVGYTASYELVVTLRRLDDLGKLLDDLVAHGANRDLGVSFGAANPEKWLDQARREAVANARKKAELYVEGAGASLGQLVAVAEGGTYPQPVDSFERVALTAQAASLPIAVGEREMTASVTLTYAINNRPCQPYSAKDSLQSK